MGRKKINLIARFLSLGVKVCLGRQWWLPARWQALVGGGKTAQLAYSHCFSRLLSHPPYIPLNTHRL